MYYIHKVIMYIQEEHVSGLKQLQSSGAIKLKELSGV